MRTRARFSPFTRLFGISFALAALGLSLLAGSAGAAFPGQNGTIVFQDYTKDFRSIAAIEPNGSAFRYLAEPAPPTAGDVAYSNPAVSWTGAKIAFDDSTNPFQGTKIYVVNADGTGLHVVADIATIRFGLSMQRPTWSPDGRTIAFDVQETSGLPTSSIYTVKSDGSQLRRLHIGGITSGFGDFDEPAWSPDGSTIAVREHRADGRFGITLLNAHQSNGPVVELTTPAVGWADHAPAWSPQGTQIVFTRFHQGTSDVMRISASGTGETNLTATDPGDYGEPAWSPSGDQILATLFDPVTGGTDLWTLDSTTGAIVGRVTTSGFADQGDWGAFSLDSTPPTITGANQTFVATSPFTTVNYALPSFTDASGIAQSGCAPPPGSGFPVGDTVVECTAVDNHGNERTQTITITVNDTAPGTGVTVTPTDNAGNTPVTVTFDSVSTTGATTLTTSSTGPPLPTGFQLGTPTIYYDLSTTAGFSTATVCIDFGTTTFPSGTPELLHFNHLTSVWDVVPTISVIGTRLCAGPVSSFSPFAIAIGPAQQADITPPTITCGIADGAWHANDVSIACTASDTGSGLALPADASFTLSTSVPAGTEVANAATASRSICDVANNCATAGPIAGNKVDRKAPTLTLPANMSVNAPTAAGAVVTFTATATDAEPNPAILCAPASGTLFTIGATTVTCTATDAVGNHASASFTVTVVAPVPATNPTVQILALIDKTIRYLDLQPLGPVFRAQLEAILDARLAKRPAAVCNGLQLYILVVKASGRAFTSAEKTELVADATRIRSALGCS